MELDKNQLAPAVLTELPQTSEPLIAVPDAIGDVEKNVSFDFVRSLVLQEDQRIKMKI